LVGFDDLIDAFTKVNANSTENASTYPPKNILRLSENKFLVQYAVAGFSKEELSVSVDKNVLVVKGIKADKLTREGSTYLYQGIGFRDFKNETSIPEDAKVKVRLENGLLSISIIKPEKHVPELAIIEIN
jgi:molecular chaperone IbpA